MESVFTSVAKVRVLNSLKNKTLNNCFTFEKFKARELFFSTALAIYLSKENVKVWLRVVFGLRFHFAFSL